MSQRSTPLATQQQQHRRSKADAAGAAGRRSLFDGALLDLGDRDVFYRTVLRYPGLPDVDDQVFLVVTNRAAETRVNQDRKKSTANRQGSVSLGIDVGRRGYANPACINNVDSMTSKSPAVASRKTSLFNILQSPLYSSLCLRSPSEVGG